MKIGFFTNTYLPINYGSTVSVETFRKGLKNLGEDVFVFAPRHKGYKDDNDFVFRYPSLMYKYKEEYPVAIPFYPPIRKKIKELNLDIIHSHQPFSLGKEGLKYAKKQNIPIVFTHHTRYEDYIHYVPILPEDLLTGLVKKEATDFANQCDLVIAPSESIKKMIQSRGVKTKVEVLPTGIDWNKFQQGARSKIRKRYKIKKNELLLLNVGRMEEEKNLEFLFDCLKNILKKQSNVKLMFVGEGSLKEKLKQKATEEKIEANILFTGLAKREEIQDFYAAGDIYLQTSTSETQGLSLYEAMAAGLPCLAVKSTGAIDAINHGQDGLLTSANQKSFRSEIKKIILDKKLRKSLSQEAVKKAKKNDASNQAKKLKKLYEKVIKNKKCF
jgi:glycosyltransferase involved in cell wall biosynthesis